MPRDNLLNSACLELFEYIKRENIKPIITHVVEKCRDKLKAVTYVDTFENLILRYDQLQGYEMEGDATLYSQQEAALPERGPVNGQWQDVRGLDAAEEEYFNTSDDEEEVCIRMHGYVEAELIMPSLQWPSEARKDELAAAQNQPPATIKLVDYPDDDDDEVMDSKSEVGIEKQEIELPERGLETDIPSTPTSIQAQHPPERLSEKRRRNDEDDDELVRLSQNGPKRRSSSASSTGSAYLRRRRNSVEPSITSKKAAGGDVSKSAAPKKIAINLSPSLKSSVTVEAEAIQISDIENTGNDEPKDDTQNEKSD